MESIVKSSIARAYIQLLTVLLFVRYFVCSYYRFEVFECGRRLALSGILVFVRKGSTSQIVVAILISLFTSALYIHWRPFERESDDNLAIVTQVSLFFTLFAALLKKVRVDKDEEYDETLFGIVLVLINCLSISMIALSQLSKPIGFLMEAMLGEKHVHDGTLRSGLNEEDARRRDKFVEHFVKVARSTREEGGWKDYTNKEADWLQFIDYTGIVVERRNSDGDGAINETRASFNLGCNINRVRDFVLNEDRDLRYGDIESHNIGGAQQNDESRKVFYLAKKMKSIYGPRDYLLEGFDGQLSDEHGTTIYIIRRSIEDENLYRMKQSRSCGRTRAWVCYEVSKKKIGQAPVWLPSVRK